MLDTSAKRRTGGREGGEREEGGGWVTGEGGTGGGRGDVLVSWTLREQGEAAQANTMKSVRRLLLPVVVEKGMGDRQDGGGEGCRRDVAWKGAFKARALWSLHKQSEAAQATIVKLVRRAFAGLLPLICGKGGGG